MATTVTAAITLLLPAGRCARPCHRQNSVTGAMLLVQAVDGCVGLWGKSLPRAAGPFLMALLHGACLLALLPLL